MNVSAGMVLIVDDSPVLSLQLQRQLQALGVSATPVDAAFARQHAGEAWLIFVDVQLMLANGFAVARQLAAAACPVVLISGTGRSTDRHWGMGTGAKAVMTRPVQLAQLQKVLDVLRSPVGM